MSAVNSTKLQIAKVKEWLTELYEFSQEEVYRIAQLLINNDREGLLSAFEDESEDTVVAWVDELTGLYQEQFGEQFGAPSKEVATVTEPELPAAKKRKPKPETETETPEPEAEPEIPSKPGAKALGKVKVTGDLPPKFPPSYGMSEQQIRFLADMVASEKSHPFVENDEDSGGVKLSAQRSMLINLLARPARLCEVKVGLVKTPKGRVQWGQKVVVNVVQAEEVIADYIHRHPDFQF